MAISASSPPFVLNQSLGLAPDPSSSGAATVLPFGAMAKPSGPLPGDIMPITWGWGPVGSMTTSASPLFCCAPVLEAMRYLPSGVMSML